MKKTVQDLLNNARSWGHSEPHIHWPVDIGKIRDKVVLDLGCGSDGYKNQEPWISTPEYWSTMGPKKIIGVEPSLDDINFITTRLNDVFSDGKFELVNDMITSSEQISNLIEQHNVNFVKSDIETGERHFLNVSDEIFSKVDDYIIEVHDDSKLELNDTIVYRLIDKLYRCNYSVYDIATFAWHPMNHAGTDNWNIWLVFAEKNK